jgi:site-specific DNA recombinase
MRFAFLGRVSTEDQQDPESSRAWQLNRARALVEPHGGVIVESFFDIGQSRSLPWQRRPEASRLLTALADPNRGFEAVVIGEPHRAFYGNQFGLTFPLFVHYGVQLWVPEVGGPLDPDNEAHDLVMSVFGGMSKGERNRIKVRVRTAMAAQTKLEGRFLGGRPPYGYSLADLGAHPNPSKAAEGRRLKGLVPDAATADVVRRIFGEFLAGSGLFAIAEGLTRDDIACPSASDPGRNRHRDGRAWSKGAVRVILTNPRYTGRQVWNKQRSDEVLLDVTDVALGHRTVHRWNDRTQWIRSDELAHEPIIDDGTFARAQELLRTNANASQAARRTRHPYLLRSLVLCGVCQRRMQGQHSHGSVYYRCRYPLEYALANRVDHPRNVIMREDVVVPRLDEWIGRLFDPDHRDATVAMMATVPQVAPIEAAASPAQGLIEEFDRELAQYRAALAAGADPIVVTKWINEAQGKRARAERELREPRSRSAGRYMTADEINDLLDRLEDIGQAIRTADPEHKAALYRDLGLILIFNAKSQTVYVRADLDKGRWAADCVGGGT